MCQRKWPQIEAGIRPAARRLYDVGVTEPEHVSSTSPDAASAAEAAGERGAFIASLMDTELYSIGAYFCDEHPDLVDEVVARSVEIERTGLEASARDGAGGVEETFETLLTGLAVRYYKAVAG